MGRCKSSTAHCLEIQQEVLKKTVILPSGWPKDVHHPAGPYIEEQSGQESVVAQTRHKYVLHGYVALYVSNVRSCMDEERSRAGLSYEPVTDENMLASNASIPVRPSRRARGGGGRLACMQNTWSVQNVAEANMG
jgi:hypothetical protein